MGGTSWLPMWGLAHRKPIADPQADRLIGSIHSTGAPGTRLRSTAERSLHQTARLGEVHLARVIRAQDRNDLAHVLDRGRAALGHCSRDRRLHLVLIHLLRKIGGDEVELGT